MNLVEALQQKPLLVGDGAMGTRLMALGAAPGQSGELWNIENPGAVAGIQREYVEAGADILLTNTFGANPLILDRHGLADRTEELNRAGVELARSAADGRAMVFGDVGPTGEMLEPLGRLSEQEAAEAFARQVRALADAGVEAIICETFDSSAEVALALRAARDCCEVPLVASMRFNFEQTGRYRTLMGEGPDALVRVAIEYGCAVVGANCGQGIETMPGLARELAGLCDLPLMIQPNAGQPRLVEGRTVYDETAECFDGYVSELHRAGARIIGGCCGTTPGHVRAVRAFADSL